MPQEEIDILLYDSDGKRARLPAKQITAASWSKTDQGGHETFSLSLLGATSDLSWVGQDYRIDMVVRGSTQVRYRGFISQISRSKGTGATPDTVEISGFGIWQRIGQVVCDKMYLEPAGRDVSWFVGRLVTDFIKSRPEYANLQVDLQEIGFTVTSLDATLKAFGDALGDLVKLVEYKAVYGVDVDDQGRDRIFLRPLGSATSPDLVGSVPSQRVTAADGEARTSDSITRLCVIGGEARFPNLIANGSFEQLRFSASDIPDSILEDAGFEDRSRWTLGGGASYKAGGLSEGATHSGNDMVETDATGEYLSQTEDNVQAIIDAAALGRAFTFGGHVRRESGGTAATGWIRLYWRTAAGAESLGYYQIDVSPLSVEWERYTDTVSVPASAAGYRLQAQNVSGSLLWDDMILFDAGLVRAANWEARANGDAEINTINWATDTDSYDGGYHVLVKVGTASDSDDQSVEIRPTQPFSVLTNQKVRVKVRLRKRPGWSGTSPKIVLALRGYEADGTEAPSPLNYTIAAGALTTSWQTFETTYSYDYFSDLKEVYTGSQHYFYRHHGSPATGAFWISIRGAGEIEIDAVEVRDFGADPNEPFVREGAYVVKFTTEDSIFSGESFYHAEDTIPPRYAIEQIDSITTWADAVQFATEYFNTRAKVQRRPTITLVGFTDRQPEPGHTIRLLGADGLNIMPTPLPVRRVRESLDSSGLLSTVMEMEREQPTVEAIIKELQRKNKRAGTVASGAAASAGGAGSSGGGSEVIGALTSTIPSVKSLNTLIGAVTVAAGDGSITVATSGQNVTVSVPSAGIIGPKLATDAVTASKIANDAVATAKIQDDAVTSAKIAANAVGTSEIAESAVTIAKISATGTASATTYLRGDGSWATPGTGGSGTDHIVSLPFEVIGDDNPDQIARSAMIYDTSPFTYFRIAVSKEGSGGGNLYFQRYDGTTWHYIGGGLGLSGNRQVSIWQALSSGDKGDLWYRCNLDGGGSSTDLANVAIQFTTSATPTNPSGAVSVLAAAPASSGGDLEPPP